MGTRAHIAYKNSNGHFEAIYHHWDGYLHHLGNLLRDNLSSETLVQELFSIKNPIESSISLEEHLKRTKIAGYNKKLLETNNYFIQDLVVKCFKKNDIDMNKVFKNKSQMKDECQQDYLYLYQDKKWEVRTPFTDDFIDLNLVLKGDLMIKEIIEMTKQQEVKPTKNNVLLKLEEEKINKAYDLLKLGTTQNEKETFLRMLISKNLFDEIHHLAKLKEKILLNEKLTTDLKEIKASPQKKI